MTRCVFFAKTLMQGWMERDRDAVAGLCSHLAVITYWYCGVCCASLFSHPPSSCSCCLCSHCPQEDWIPAWCAQKCNWVRYMDLSFIWRLRKPGFAFSLGKNFEEREATLLNQSVKWKVLILSLSNPNDVLQKKKIPRDLKIKIIFPARLLYGLLSERGLGHFWHWNNHKRLAQNY